MEGKSVFLSPLVLTIQGQRVESCAKHKDHEGSGNLHIFQIFDGL